MPTSLASDRHFSTSSPKWEVWVFLFRDAFLTAVEGAEKRTVPTGALYVLSHLCPYHSEQRLSKRGPQVSHSSTF